MLSNKFVLTKSTKNKMKKNLKRPIFLFIVEIFSEIIIINCIESRFIMQTSNLSISRELIDGIIL